MTKDGPSLNTLTASPLSSPSSSLMSFVHAGTMSLLEASDPPNKTHVHITGSSGTTAVGIMVSLSVTLTNCCTFLGKLSNFILRTARVTRGTSPSLAMNDAALTGGVDILAPEIGHTGIKGPSVVPAVVPPIANTHKARTSYNAMTKSFKEAFGLTV